jgi:two-component system OmpR family response regulator
MKKILVVDDEDDIRRFLELVLREKGYEIETASGGEEGLATARSFRPDLVLLDIMMPGLDGWQVLERLKADPATSDIPVAILSARTETKDPAHWRDKGAVAYVTKPFSLQTLFAKLQEILAAVGEQAKAGASEA